MYCEHDTVEKLVGPEPFALMLDDDKDGIEDDGLFDVLAQAASDQVDGYLGGRYEVPFSAVPAFVRQCAQAFCAESLYQRRGVARDANPWSRQADALRERLQRISEGKEKLSVSEDEAGSAVEVQTEDSRIAQDGRMMF